MDLRSLLSLSLLATAQKQYAASDDVAQHSVRQPYVFDWQTGTATGQANKIYRRRGTLSAAQVTKFRDIPDRKTLLAQVLSAVTAPVTGVLGLTQNLLSSPAALAEALAKKQEKPAA